MLIINADDWGINQIATNNILKCINNQVVTSTTAMVFMSDSLRAANIATSHQLSVGLHLNMTSPFTGNNVTIRLLESQKRLLNYYTKSKYARLIFNPLLIDDIKYCFNAQFEEFLTLYNKAPTHIDGHHHMHLCANMIFSDVVPKGCKIRRNFTFKSGQKSSVNRLYRKCIDLIILNSHKSTDFFYKLRVDENSNDLNEIIVLADKHNVELMVHPELTDQYNYLNSTHFMDLIRHVTMGNYCSI
jgi:chitin disaccharide deacetylase